MAGNLPPPPRLELQLRRPPPLTPQRPTDVFADRIKTETEDDHSSIEVERVLITGNLVADEDAEKAKCMKTSDTMTDTILSNSISSGSDTPFKRKSRERARARKETQTNNDWRPWNDLPPEVFPGPSQFDAEDDLTAENETVGEMVCSVYKYFRYRGSMEAVEETAACCGLSLAQVEPLLEAGGVKAQCRVLLGPAKHHPPPDQTLPLHSYAGDTPSARIYGEFRKGVSSFGNELLIWDSKTASGCCYEFAKIDTNSAEKRDYRCVNCENLRAVTPNFAERNVPTVQISINNHALCDPDRPNTPHFCTPRKAAVIALEQQERRPKQKPRASSFYKNSGRTKKS